MRFYCPTLNTVQHRKSPAGNTVSILKFTVVLVICLGMVSFAAWQRAKHNQGIREMRKELAALDKQQEELKMTLQNRANQLEHLMEGKYITACANEIGLRQPTPKQQFITIQNATAQNKAKKRIVGYVKR
ncbi:MAG: hypothetical protein MJ106_04855 [Lentisphaeria bacterium]|nr:hypothetical protein [Lentisphaeria bacterium]